MSRSFLCFLIISVILLAGSNAAIAISAKKPLPPLNKRQRALHLLNRLAFGPRPGELEALEALGEGPWLEAQLHPETLDDQACEDRLKELPEISKNAYQLYLEYPPLDRPAQANDNPSMMQAQTQEAEQKAYNERLRSMESQWEEAKLIRILYSKRDLQEVMTDFWFNHFNVNEQKNQDKWLFGPYERDVIRPLALGKFGDLLLATAKSSAMLVYLDNAQSTADLRYVPDFQKENMENSMMKAEAQGKKVNQGLNENYARELMELHTMGVDSGYTQDDVIAAARVLTGWSIQYPRKPGSPIPSQEDPSLNFTFKFRPKMHDQGIKNVLGHQFGPNEGEAEGEALLKMLAHEPATAHFIASQLCRRFVSDDPPKALVERVTRSYLKNDTDILACLKTIVQSPEFWDPRYYHAKVKTPLEFVASSLRASGAEIKDEKKIDQILESMGEPSYRCEPPTGYPEVASAWVSSSALLSRLNFGMLLFDPQHSPAKVDLGLFESPSQSPAQRLDGLLKGLLHGDVTATTRQVLALSLKDPEISHRILDDKVGELQVGKLAALILGSPEFQRR